MTDTVGAVLMVVVVVVFAYVLGRLAPRADEATAPVKETVRELTVTNTRQIIKMKK